MLRTLARRPKRFLKRTASFLMNLELTVAGKALYPQLLAAKERVAAQFLRGFSQEEVGLLEGLLHRMLENR